MAVLGRAIDVACFSGSIHKQFLTHQNRQLENYGFTPGRTSSMKRCRGFFLPCSRTASHARRRRKPSMSISSISFMLFLFAGCRQTPGKNGAVSHSVKIAQTQHGLTHALCRGGYHPPVRYYSSSKNLPSLGDFCALALPSTPRAIPLKRKRGFRVAI